MSELTTILYRDEQYAGAQAVKGVVPVNCCIQTENLCLCYGDKMAIENVSLRIHTGAITAIIGPSGSGKSSFLGCLNRLTDFAPDCRVTGCVKLHDRDVQQGWKDVLELRRRVGMVFQKPNPFPFSIWRNLEFPLRQHGVTRKEDIAAKIEQGLRDVGLWEEVKDRLYGPALSLSGGQQQRLCLARTLVLNPEIILMDEPCSALDPLSADGIENLIRDLRGRCTVVIVTHNLAQARRLADYVAMFWSENGVGRVIEYGAAEHVFERPMHRLTAAYLSSWR